MFMAMMTPDPEVYIIDVDNEFVIPRHHRFADGGNEVGTTHLALTSSLESEAVSQLLRRQQRTGTVDEWAPGYRAELNEVTRRRLRPLPDDEVIRVGAVQKAVRLSVVGRRGQGLRNQMYQVI